MKLDADWLIQREEQYGGSMWGPRVLSPHDTRTGDEIPDFPIRGGNRMGGNGNGYSGTGHNYGRDYVRYLGPYLERNPGAVLVEVGVLGGIGLAVWCDLPFSRVIGLDVMLGTYRENEPDLRERGAFQKLEPEVYDFDQFTATPDVVAGVLAGDRAGVVIDDASHVDVATLRTLDAFRPHLADDYLYFIEDSWKIGEQIDDPGIRVTSHRNLNVLQPKERT